MNQNSKNYPSPVVFVLKEGKTIQTNFLDYSLMFLHTQCLEALHGEHTGNIQGPYLQRLQDELKSCPKSA